METREQKGLVIASTTKIQGADDVSTIPSQSGNGRYTVKSQDNTYRCNCPDFETRWLKCKHIHAVEYTISREQSIEVSTDAKA